MNNKNPFNPKNEKGLIHIRRNIQDYNDPYISEEQLHDNSICSRCGDVYLAGRWYSRDLVPKEKTHAPAHETICPACRKQQDRVPGGVIKITGDFFRNHEDEIMNLIRNETSRAQAVNPLERLMNIDSDNGDIEITTTNEKLAQRIGRALHKAYNGHIEYKWSEDNKLARVNWHREA